MLNTLLYIHFVIAALCAVLTIIPVGVYSWHKINKPSITNKDKLFEFGRFLYLILICGIMSLTPIANVVVLVTVIAIYRLTMREISISVN